MRRRAQFSQFLSSNASLTANRYFRLMSLATIELIFNVPISSYGLYLNITASPIHPWKGWANTHFDWYTVDTFPAVIWRSNRQSVVTLELSRWAMVFCSLVFFGFFGFADEALKHYRLVYWAVAKRFGVSPPPSSTLNAYPGYCFIFLYTPVMFSFSILDPKDQRARSP
jgi:pheromone a factor receptor